ncbi:ATP-binding protein [Xanthomonas hortorum]|uniref:ATP-binding protein n=1 Tax=Xanthomonas hortorum TaxID=56454 RepID=UPI0015934BF6|nr:ATP-binding protein [Xanthomonas hortorum]NHF68461.1 hypothetical protein [Xanthomonas hortorum]
MSTNTGEDMYISRIQVTEGFLDGLDISLSPGLNVLIGARGTGKTSVIELLRYCLDVPGHTPESNKRSKEHALSILGTGEVVVTISTGGEDMVFRRAAGDVSHRIAASQMPIVFSQTEIETVGLQSTGRLRLIDGFATNLRELSDREEAATASVHSATVQIDSAQRELDELSRQLADMPRVDAELAKLAPAELDLEKLSAASAEKTGALGTLSHKLSSASVESEKAGRALDHVMQWRHRIQSVVDASPSLVELQRFPELTATAQNASNLLQSAIHEIEALEQAVRSIKEANEAERATIERDARTLRQEVETLQEGSGAIISTGMKLRERKAQLLALNDLFRGKRDALGKV